MPAACSDLVLVQAEPQQWVNAANLMPLAELRRRAPHAIDWSPLQEDVGSRRRSEIERADTYPFDLPKAGSVSV